VALSLNPPFLPAGLWLPLSLQTGEWKLVVGNGFLLLAVAATWCSLSILAGALAGRILDGRREPKVNWLVITACVAVPFVLLIVVPRWAQQDAVVVSPAGAYQLSSSPVSSIVTDGDRIAVTTANTLELIDFSDPANPRPLASVPRRSRTVSAVRITGSSAYVVEQSLGPSSTTDSVLRIDLTGAAAREAEPILSLDAAGRRLLGSPFLIANSLYLATYTTSDGEVLRVFDLSAAAGAHETAALAIDGSVMAVKSNYAYVLCRSELVTLDVTDPARPRIARRTPLDPKRVSLPRGVIVAGYGLYAPRRTPIFARSQWDVAVAADGLYTPGSFPTSLLRFDLRNPANPVLASQTPTGLFLGEKGLASDEASSTLMVVYRDGVLAFRAPTGLLLHDVRYLKPSERSAQRIAIGRRCFYAWIEGNRVAAFPLPRIN
jgi:hypothetical protein